MSNLIHYEIDGIRCSIERHVAEQIAASDSTSRAAQHLRALLGSQRTTDAERPAAKGPVDIQALIDAAYRDGQFIKTVNASAHGRGLL